MTVLTIIQHELTRDDADLSVVRAFSSLDISNTSTPATECSVIGCYTAYDGSLGGNRDAIFSRTQCEMGTLG